jgi:hypothetical protein
MFGSAAGVMVSPETKMAEVVAANAKTDNRIRATVFFGSDRDGCRF